MGVSKDVIKQCLVQWGQVSVSPNVRRLMTKIARHRVGVALMFLGVPYGWHRLLHTRFNLFLVGCHLFIF